LRFLQEGEVKPLGSDKTIKCNVRIIAASNQLLDVLISKGQFRKDLYYRLNGFQLNIPPLRSRIEDVEVLADYLVRQFSEKANRRILGISPAVLEQFSLYDWPGNVRELENEIMRMIAVTDSGTFIAEEHLSSHIRALKPTVKSRGTALDLEGISLKEKVEKMEAEIIAHTLKRLRWNQSRAALELGLSRVGLANKIKRYGLGAESSVA
jgi:two-component system response regulator HupR/HoxA